MAHLSGDCSDLFEKAHVRAKPGRTLIAGSRVYNDKPDRRKRFSDAVGVDMVDGPGVDIVQDLEQVDQDEVDAINLGTFAHIECLSVLEHSPRPWRLAENLTSLLEPGGTIYVSVPFVWRIHAYPDDFFRFTPAGLRAIFPGIAWEQFAFGWGTTIRPVEDKLPTLKRGGIPFFARTETFGFGRRLW